MNKVIIQGRLTKEPELKTSANNVQMLSFTVAVDRRFKKEGEEKQADFIMCKAFNKTAEMIAKFFTKGRQIIVCGHIQTGSYEKDGQKIYTTDVIADEFYFSGSANSEPKADMQEGFVPTNNDDELPF